MPPTKLTRNEAKLVLYDDCKADSQKLKQKIATQHILTVI